MGVLSAYRGYEPTGATGIAKLSPEDLAEMKPGANLIAKYSDSVTAQQAVMPRLEQGQQAAMPRLEQGQQAAMLQLEQGQQAAAGPTELRFKSLENGRTSNSDDADKDGADLEGQEAEEIDTARKLSNKGFLLISQYSDAHRSLVDAENNKDQAETEIRTTMKAINVLGSRLQALHEKRGSPAFKSCVRNGVFQRVKSFMAATEKLKSLRSSERKENQEALDETTRSVEQYEKQHKQNEEAVKNATRVEKELEEKRIALDDAISSLTKMLKLAKEDLARTTQFLESRKTKLKTPSKCTQKQS